MKGQFRYNFSTLFFFHIFKQNVGVKVLTYIQCPTCIHTYNSFLEKKQKTKKRSDRTL